MNEPSDATRAIYGMLGFLGLAISAVLFMGSLSGSPNVTDLAIRVALTR